MNLVCIENETFLIVDLYLPSGVPLHNIIFFKYYTVLNLCYLYIWIIPILHGDCNKHFSINLIWTVSVSEKDY